MATATTSRPAFVEKLLADNRANTDRATRIVDRLTLEQLRWRPSPGAWGIGHCLDHLRLGAEIYIPALEDAIARAHSKRLDAPPDMQHRHSLMGRIMIKTLSPTGRRMKAPRDITPPAECPDDVVERFLTSQRRLGELIEEIAGLDVNRVRMSSPELRIIRMNVADALEMLVVHVVRHLNQAEAVTNHPGFLR